MAEYPIIIYFLALSFTRNQSHIATQETITRSHIWAASTAINLLSRYQGADLLEIFVMLLSNQELKAEAIYALKKLGDARALPTLRELFAQEENPYTLQLLISTVTTLGQEAVIDLVLSYLTHPHPEIRKEALSRVLNLAKAMEQEQWACRVLPLLEDPVPNVRRFAALCLQSDFPHLLPD